MTFDDDTLPAHVEEAIRSIADLHAEHSKRTSHARFRIARFTSTLGRPAFLRTMMAAVVAWMVLNVTMLRFGHRPFDPPPFSWLQGTVSGLALFMTMLILSTQQREDAIGEQRDQLALQLAILGEQKLTKVIGMLEDLRRDDPSMPNRSDAQAAAMAIPTDALAMSEAIQKKIEPKPL
jgi:uncharacterized membrane protein